MSNTTYKRTNELRRLVTAKLATLPAALGVKKVYYGLADTGAMFPHVVFSITSANIGDHGTRKDYMIDIDVYTKNDAEKAEDIADEVEKLFFYTSDNSGNVDLVSYFCENRIRVEDDDKAIKRVLVRINAQLYEI